MTASLEDILNKNRLMVIDGSMSTALENLGVRLNDRLWTARVLDTAPELVKQVHINYLRAGADCGITCSYQATIAGLMENGFSLVEAEALITRSVEVFLEAREQWWAEEGNASGRAFPLCLGSVGPYGAYLADGSEYTGAYDVDDATLLEFHRRRMELLHRAGADLLLLETQPSLREALLAAGIAEELGADYWVSFSCRDGEHTHRGEAMEECAHKLSHNHPHLRMLGVNCTKPEYVPSLIRHLKSAIDLPIAVYPNSGQEYDPETKTWMTREGQLDFGAWALTYFREGAAAVGGCCTTVESHIEQVVQARARYLAMGAPQPISLRKRRTTDADPD